MSGAHHFKKIVISGRFLSQRITGVQRYAIEITKELDSLAKEFHVPTEIAVPSDRDENFSNTISEFRKNLRNIKIVTVGKRQGVLWEQIDLPRYVRGQSALGIYLCNVIPLLAPAGLVCIHDITYKVNPKFVTTWRLKIIQLWNKLQFRVATKKSLHIFTVSEFSKRQISEVYNVPLEKITVASNAWQHFGTKILRSDSLDAFPFLKDKNYFFALATLAKNKNFRWIMENARHNPNLTYAIAGNMDKKKLGNTLGEIPANVHLLGYVSDEYAKILLKHCKAFLFPSLYEGFGLPPLEALAMGVQVICSNAASLPEVFGESAHYIDPFDADVDLEKLLLQTVAPSSLVLNKYSWTRSAKCYADMINEVLRNKNDDKETSKNFSFSR